MTKRKALAKLLNGETNKVRKNVWVGGHFILIREGKLFNNFGDIYGDVLALDEDGWEIVSIKEIEITKWYNVYEHSISKDYRSKEQASENKNSKCLDTVSVSFKAPKEEWIS